MRADILLGAGALQISCILNQPVRGARFVSVIQMRGWQVMLEQVSFFSVMDSEARSELRAGVS